MKLQLTAQQLAISTGARIDRAVAWLTYIVMAMQAYDITTPEQQAAFLAQIGHESGGLHYATELWGPTPAQARYEGRKDLGNVQIGDGFKFRGHGLIQVTGRTNHAAARDRLRDKFGDTVPDFEQQPEALADMQWASLSAAEFWARHGLNDIAGDCLACTRKINGGTNGLQEREQLFAAAQGALGVLA